MLLRNELKKTPAGNYDRVAIHLSGYTFYCERDSRRGFDAWVIPGCLDVVRSGETNRGEVRVVSEADEFTAQAVFDHYLAKYPPLTLGSNNALNPNL